MAQRLVRVLCPNCKESRPATAEDNAMWDRLVAPMESQPRASSTIRSAASTAA